MKVKSNLPWFMTALTYAAMGLCLSVSWAQMQVVLKDQAQLTGWFIQLALPAAILFGGLVLWRMAGHLYNRTQNRVRTFGFAFGLSLMGALFCETISVSTSTLSLAMNINKMVKQDIESQASYKTADTLSSAATQAAKRLTEDLANTPDNYRTQARQTTEALTELLDAQSRLAESQAANSLTASPTERTFSEVGSKLGINGEDLKYLWALLLGIGLSFIPLASQFCLGATSDGGMVEDEGEIDYLDSTSKKPQRRGPRPTSAVKRESVPAAIKHRNPMESTSVTAATPADPVAGQAVEALLSLGYKKGEAKRMAESAAGDSVEIRTRNALRNTQPKRESVADTVVAKVRADIKSGALAKVTNQSLTQYSTSSHTREKVIQQLVREGVLKRQNNGRVSIAD